MSRVKARDTKPEIIVRRILHSLGYRFTINGPKNKKFPGKPDVVLPKYQSVLFVHGCFWHRHQNCKHATTPQNNRDYWTKKFSRNVERDRENESKLTSLGWKVLTIWECQLKDLDAVVASLIAELPRSSTYQLPSDLEDQTLAAETAARYGKHS
ncbi:very short patch repair endonuclease [Puniceicoccaceae bacterium K14]|nr:very short patch repair endonuclease [Puniceicoccaceae bacterium K14]